MPTSVKITKSLRPCLAMLLGLAALVTVAPPSRADIAPMPERKMVVVPNDPAPVVKKKPVVKPEPATPVAVEPATPVAVEPEPIPAAGAPMPIAAPMPEPPQPEPTAGELRATCAAAMNADPSFADAIMATVREAHRPELEEADRKAHEASGASIAKNQRHVILAYAAMWLLAIGFVVFLWMRQARLRREITALRADLDRAAKS